MKQTFIEKTDFDIFFIPGLEPRMQAIRQKIQPKFALISQDIADFLSISLQTPIYSHIAKHARRTVHPPNKTWIAWSSNKRGYKPNPHFQLAMNAHSIFIWFAVFSECKQKKQFATHLKERLSEVWYKIPKNYLFSEDHTKDENIKLENLSFENIQEKLNRISLVKKAEFLCGLQLRQDQCVQQSLFSLLQQIKGTFTQVKPLYEISVNIDI